MFAQESSFNNKEENFFSPNELRRSSNPDSITTDISLGLSKKTSNKSSPSPVLNPTNLNPSVSAPPLDLRFVKKQAHFSAGNPVKRFFDDDLNLQFADDPTKFLGKFSSSDGVYMVERQFLPTTTSGLKIYHSRFIPLQTQPIATLLVVHGFCEHSGLYINGKCKTLKVRVEGMHPGIYINHIIKGYLEDEINLTCYKQGEVLGEEITKKHFADYFTRQGYEVHLYDQRGFGFTGGITRHSSTKEFQEDLTTIIAQASTALPLEVYAHSTGALGVLAYLISNPECRIASLVLLNAFLRVPKHYNFSMNKRILSKFLLLFYEDLLVNSKINLSALCKNSYHIRKIIKDEHISAHLTLRMAMSIIEMCNIVEENAWKITVPILLLHGTEDVVSKKENSLNLYKKIGSSIKDLRFIDGAFHQPHLDTGSQDLYALIAQWISTKPMSKKISPNSLQPQPWKRIGKSQKLLLTIMAFIWIIRNKPFIIGLISRAKCLAMLYSLIKLAKVTFTN